MIGIITFHRAANYGTVLQAYGLQKTLDLMGIQNEIIDYRCEFIEKLYQPLPNVSIKHPRQFWIQLISVHKKYRVRKKFDSFIQNYLRTGVALEKQDLRNEGNKYGGIITGSDQVWHLALSDEDLSFLLDFVPDGVKRLSYAVSLGPAIISQKYLALLNEYIPKMDWISVREDTALEQLKDMSRITMTLDPDPSVLLEISEWEKIANNSSRRDRNYIFVYTMQPSDILFDVAESIAKEEKLEILSISMVRNPRKIGKDITGIGVDDYLYLIKNASYVVTNSFHGLMFSIRFHKRFYWAYQNGNHMSNPRFDMLTNLYHIDCRKCDNASLYKKCSDMDYEMVESVLEMQRNLGKKHLSDMIEGRQQ